MSLKRTNLVTMNRASERSQEKIRSEDLRRLAKLAQQDLDAFFGRKRKTAQLYRSRLLALALCQGAAEHFVRLGHGVKDFDVWAFFEKSPTRPFPYRRRGMVDFGESRFGHHPTKNKGYTGRTVDVIGRSIPKKRGQSSEDAILSYLVEAKTASAKHLRIRPVVMLFPTRRVGHVIWDPRS